MELTRKLSAKYAKSIFFDEYNDIDVYIEDTAKGCKKLFTEILNNVFEGKYHIQHVFPLGGRIEVINKCRQSQEYNNRKEIFIIDGDLYLLTDDSLKELKKLFCLNRYCIENYLIEEKAILNIMDEEDIYKDYTKLKEELNYQEWIEKNNELFTNLYIEYAIAKIICPDISTISYKITKLVSSNIGLLDKNKVEQRINEVKKEIIDRLGEEIYKKTRCSIESKIDCRDTNFIIKYVSGKDHLFPLLKTRINTITKISVRNTSLKLRLAKKIYFSDLKEILEIIDSQDLSYEAAPAHI